MKSGETLASVLDGAASEVKGLFRNLEEENESLKLLNINLQLELKEWGKATLVTCVRCDREFYSIPDQRFCSPSCERGEVEIPNQKGAACS